MAITNDGIVLPCCECDTRQSWKNQSTPAFIQLVEKSNINNFNTINDIINQPIWKRFQNELLDDIGPDWCYEVCAVNKDDRRESKKVVYEK